MMRKFLIPALLLSFAVNLFAGAFLVGQSMQSGTQNELAGILLSRDELGPLVRPSLSLNSPALSEALERLRNARQKVRAVSAERPVDVGALETAFADVRVATTGVQIVIQEAMVHQLSE